MINRRAFLQSTPAAAGLAIPLAPALAASDAPIRVGVIGASGRARSLYQLFAKNPEVDLVSIADVDTKNFARAVEEIGASQGGSRPETHQDFRQLVNDDSIDALVVGTPDEWHASPTINGCLAGKDVYVETPDAPNMIQGQAMVRAAKESGRIVQMGAQHRSSENLQSALTYIREGHLGEATAAKAWENSEGKSAELGARGLKLLDVAFSALSAAVETNGGAPLKAPTTISAQTGDRKNPDAFIASYEFAGSQPSYLTFEQNSWTSTPANGFAEGSAVYGDRGHITIGDNEWKAYGADGRLVAEHSSRDNADELHVQNFIDCVRTRNRPNAELETAGHPASVLAHAGNISARLGRVLTLNPHTERFENDDEANALQGIC